MINAYKLGRSLVKKEKIDIIHSNNFSPALAGSLISYFSGASHITTIHDIFSLYGKDFWKKWTNQSGVSHINARFVPCFEKLMMKFRFDCIHTLSDATRNDIQKIGNKKTAILDASTPISPKLIETLPVAGQGRVMVEGNYLYILDTKLVQYDISFPASPIFVSAGCAG